MRGSSDESASIYTLPAPVTGWNARDTYGAPPELGGMSETDAIRLVNLFPDGPSVTLRRGFSLHSSGMGSGSVQSLFEYTSAAGAKKLVAAANGNLYDATTSGGSASSLSSGFTSNKWQGIIFGHTLILVNGVDQPQQYTGGVATAAAVYTGVTDENLVNVSAYRSRLYFVEINTAKVWYGSVDAITGALTAYDFKSLLRRGGYVLFAGSWTSDFGKGLQDIFVVVSSEGEILLYEGDYPTATDWTIVGRFFVGAPLGRRASINLGPDLIIMTQEGFYPLSDLISADTARTYSKLSDKIRDAVTEATRNYSANFGWTACHYQKGHYVLFNIPIASDTQYEQFVVNNVTGAWCRFTGQNGASWAVYNNGLYFGGIDGKVYKADSGASDNGNFISIDMKQAFSYCGDREGNKRFLMGRPIIFGDDTARFLFDIDVDFEDKQIASTVQHTGTFGSAWDTADWDTSAWDTAGGFGKDWFSISGIGRAAALRIKADLMNTELSLSSTSITYERGSIL